MAQQPSDDKKLDFSNLPRGAIGLKGLPVSRNTRLPSIRSPRDLTLGATPKRTFMPNIPVRREKKSQTSDSVLQVKQENAVKIEKKSGLQVSDRGRGRGRVKQIIQTQGSIFSDGVAADALSRKEKIREAYQKSDYSASPRGISIKKEKEDKDIAGVSTKMDQLFRDDFIDDGEEESDDFILKPVIFPLAAVVKKDEAKCEVAEPAVNFDPDIAKEMNFDVNRVAKFIKKEKGTEIEDEKKSVISQEAVSQEVPSQEVPSNEITNLLNTDTNSSKLVLLKLPQFLNVTQKMDDSEPSHRRPASIDPKVSDNQNTSLASIKCLSEGYVGKLQVLRSGKTRLLVGSAEFILDSVNSLEKSKHEVVSVTTDSNSGDLCVLGSVKDMLKFAPNEDSLLG